MPKWADYLISGIWVSKHPHSHVSFVFLHEDTEGGFKAGIKKSEAEVIKLIKAGYSVKTIEWNYKNAGWIQGADVGRLTVDGTEYLRSHKDKKVIDNLKNLIRMDDFSI
jgi:hypothetical protein